MGNEANVMQSQIEDLRGRVVRLENEAARKDQHEALVGRMDRLENKLDDLSDDLGEIKADVKAILAKDQGRVEGSTLGVQPGGLSTRKVAVVGAGTAGGAMFLFELAKRILEAIGG